MIDDATIKRVVDAEMVEYYDGAYADSSCARDQLTRFARAIEQLARQEQREEILTGYDFFKSEGKWIADAIRASGKENSNE